MKKHKIGKLLQPIPLDFETVLRAFAATKPPPKKKTKTEEKRDSTESIVKVAIAAKARSVI